MEKPGTPEAGDCDVEMGAEASQRPFLDELPHPIASASWFSRLTWMWFFPLLWLGQRKQLDVRDVWELPPTMRARAIHQRYMERCRRYPNMSLRMHLIYMFWKRWAIAGACYAGWCVSAAVQPYLVAAIVNHVAHEEADTGRGLLLALALFVATITYSFFINHKFAQLMENGVEIRSLLMTLLYRKVLSVSLDAGISTGEATNLISNDAERVLDASLWLHYMWASPIFVLIIIALAYIELGPAALVGFGLLFLIIPIQVYFGKRVGARKRRAMPKTDRRTELFSQVLNGIEVVKLYAWEEPYATTLQATRVEELSELLVINLIRASMRAILFIAPALIPGVTLMAYVGFGNDLTLEAAFLAISFFATVRFPTLIIPMAYSYFYEMLVSMNRIDTFLAMPDAPALGVVNEEQAMSDSAADGKPTLLSPVVASNLELSRIKDPLSVDWAGVFWDSDKARQVLHNVALEVAEGSLVGVTGVVGAGKTAFLLALLDEIPVAQRKGRPSASAPVVGYFAQTPQIMNGTFEDNVTFGLPFDRARFDEAVCCACLDADLAIMPAGSQTEIGENGVNLSGGQKARVAFARLLYHRDRCSLFLIDDLFSAVDVHVGKKMFERGVDGLLGGKTRIVAASSQVDLLHEADMMLNILDGHVEISKTMLGTKMPARLTKEVTNPIHNTTEISGDGIHEPEAKVVVTTNGTKTKSQEAGEHLTTKEARVAGAVSARVVRGYFDLSHPGHGTLLMYTVGCVYILGQTIRVMCDVWIAWWADTSSNGGDSTAPDTLERQDDTYWMWTLAVWNVSNIVFAFTRSLWCAVLAAKASEEIHKVVLKSLLAAPLLYFHQNPPGRLLNRLSTDLHKIDILLPDILYQFLDNFILLLSALVLAVVAVPWLLVLLLILGYFYYKIQQLYRSTSRELHRLDSTTKSPIFGLCTESVSARVTIRAYGMTKYFTQVAENYVNSNLKVFLSVKLLERWISTYMNLAATVFGTTIVLVAVLARDQVDPALVGLALVYSLQLMGLSSWTMMIFVQVEATLTSLERLQELSNVPPQEHQAVSALYKKPPPSWPMRGKITFKEAKLRYRDDLPLALKGISLDVQPQEKIGICGRTGAGKSSVLALLFRLFEPESGSTIEVDGVDITSVKLSNLRDALAIVPQDPVLFNGTVRSNLDPWGRFDDAALWAVLDQVTLRATVTSMPAQLDESTGRAGDRLSHGQRQLMCIARALLKPSKILLCDEATSSVDGATDAMIQQLIRDAFRNRTVLTIAHRLHTILDSDRVLVLEAGEVAEFDTPAELLQREGGLFKNMLETTSAGHIQSAVNHEGPANAHDCFDGDLVGPGRLRNASMPHVLELDKTTLRRDSLPSFADDEGVVPMKLNMALSYGLEMADLDIDSISEVEEVPVARRSVSYLEATQN